MRTNTARKGPLRDSLIKALTGEWFDLLELPYKTRVTVLQKMRGPYGLILEVKRLPKSTTFKGKLVSLYRCKNHESIRS